MPRCFVCESCSPLRYTRPVPKTLETADLLRISRPRFWIYVFGPFLVGLAAAISSPAQLLTIPAVVYGLYFLFPANLLIYGINDIFDYETDRRNPKKNNYEALVTPEKRRPLAVAILATNLPFLAVLPILWPAAMLAMSLFIFFAVFYSAPPIRAKTKPILDSAFNVLYVFPGAVAYQLVTGEFPPIATIVAGGLWTMAMHAYSAIPDISADREAGIATVATLLGRNGTLLFCLAMYLASAALAFSFVGWAAVVLGTLFATMIFVSFASSEEGGIFNVYRWFPLVNAAAGFLLFWYIFGPKAF